MTRSLNDCHTFFLPPQRAEVLTDVRTGRGSGGIGVELAAVKPSYVRETINDGPAQRAGVLPGDYLISVDGKDVTGLGIDVITELLRGDPGSDVSIQVRRPSNGTVLSFPMTRSLVQPPVASGQVLDGGVGYIRIRSFTTNGTLLAAIDKIVAGFEAEGITAWSVDLRDNPGGDSDLDLDGRFIGEQVAERLNLRNGGSEINDGLGEAYADRPIAVLVNGGTASVGEIFASMLQDYGRGRVFGTQTAKCAGFVNLTSFPDGSTIAVTIAHALTPKTQKPLWQTGVIPDQAVRQTQDDIAADRDPVLDAAVAWLKTQAR
jgi:carboxyl-terminal processing protease